MSTITIAPSSISSRAFHAPFQRQIRAGAIALILAGIADALVPLGTSGTITNPADNVAFAIGANTLRWRLAMVSGLVYQALLVLGLLALYVHLARTRAQRWAFAGLVVTVGLTMLFVPMMGFAAFVVPAVGALIEPGILGVPAFLDVPQAQLVAPLVGGAALMSVGLSLWKRTISDATASRSGDRNLEPAV